MTNIVGFEARASIERQAREWLIRVDGDEPLADREKAALREWMGRSPIHRQGLTRLARFWSQADVLTELAVPLGLETRYREHSDRRSPLRLSAVACAALASVALAWWYFQPFNRTANGTYGSAIGQLERIQLSDGSTVQLNTDTQVQVTYNHSLRRIRLLRGEALFTVARDPSRPFEVYVADSVVRALGTAFAIRLDGSNVDLTVTSGAVDVAEPTNSPSTVGTSRRSANDGASSSVGRVTAGQMTRFGSGSHNLEVHPLAAAEMQRRMAWREGYLVFSGQPLSEVVTQVNRYSPVTVEIGDPKLSSVAIGGRFRIGELDAILEVLHTNFGIESRQLSERSIRLESLPPR